MTGRSRKSSRGRLAVRRGRESAPDIVQAVEDAIRRLTYPQDGFRLMCDAFCDALVAPRAEATECGGRRR